MTDYSEWANKYNEGQLKGFLKEYNDWAFGENHPNQIPGKEKVFIHGLIDSPNARKDEAPIKRGKPIIVHVIGTNFVKGDRDAGNRPIENDEQITRACQDDAGNDGVNYVRIKGPGENDWTNLDQYVLTVKSPPNKFTANNPDLGKWRPPMPPGEQRGAWLSKLLVLQVPQKANTGVYELECQGHASKDYVQTAHFKINVE
jgi:hypothetical protein